MKGHLPTRITGIRATLPTLLFAGIGLLAAGALWELDIYRRGAWRPS
jgi:hypothetical protein